MQRPDQFMVVAFTEHQAAWQSYGKRATWPQHMTVIPWVERWRAQATNRLADAVTGFGVIHADIVGEAKFGDDDVPMWTLGPCDILQRLHRQVRDAVLKYGTEWAPDVDSARPYKPHVTIKPGQPEHEIGERLIFPELSVIGCHEVLGKMVFANVSLDGHEAVV